MPCKSDYLEPTQRERESLLLMGLLSEIGQYIGKIPHYGKVEAIDKHTAILCEFCQNNDVTRYSLELQIWWRDHQIADRKRVRRERLERKHVARIKALAKLTPYERKLLGL